MKFKFFLLILIPLGILSCGKEFEFGKKALDLSRENTITVDELSKEENIIVSPSPLTFVLKLKPYTAERNYAYRITAFTNPAIFSSMREGQSVENIPFFEGGTGMAAPDTGYQSLYIRNDAHHYICYETNEPGTRRGESHFKDKDYLIVKAGFKDYIIDGTNHDFEKLGGQRLYLAFFQDDNLNQKLDSGEYHQVVLIFKKH